VRPDAEELRDAGQDVAEHRRRGLGRTSAGVGILLHQWHDHEGAPARGDLAEQERVGPGLVGLPRNVLRAPDQLSCAADPGGDRLASDRSGPQVGDVEVGVEDAPEGLGDGRRGHQQDVRRRPLRPEGLALGDAEAVLLVDDGQGQVAEGDGLLDERVGADHDEPLGPPIDPRPRSADGVERRASRGGPKGPGQERHRVAERLEEAGQRHRVLPGEQVGRRQQGRLPVRVGDARHRGRGDRRLARSDVALEEPEHRPW
jgi:hypothetical protein